LYTCSLPALANHLKQDILTVQRELVRLRSLKEIRIIWSQPSIVCQILQPEHDDARLENICKFVLNQIRLEELRRWKQKESMQILLTTLSKKYQTMQEAIELYYNQSIATTIKKLVEDWTEEERESIKDFKLIQSLHEF
jgi:hypothetical protein